MLHPILWPDLIIALLIAEGIFHSTRAILHHISDRRNNQLIAQRVADMRPAVLDNYRVLSKESVRAPLG